MVPSGSDSSSNGDAWVNAGAERLATQLGGVAYQKQFREALSEYQTQRAWRLMLIARKAYSLAFARGWNGRWRLAKWLAGVPFRGFTGLEEYDLTFPNLAAYLPPAYRTSLIVPGTGVAERQTFPRPPGPETFDVLILPVFDYEFRFSARNNLRWNLLAPDTVSSGLALHAAPSNLMKPSGWWRTFGKSAWEASYPIYTPAS